LWRLIWIFNKKELELLATAYQTFIGRIHVFDVLGDKSFKDTGIENWVKTELIVALIDRGYEATTIETKKLGCDLFVKEEKLGLDVSVEIKTITHTSYYKEILVKQGLQKYPNVDLFLFLAKVDSVVLKELDDYFRQHGYIEEHRMLNDDWMTMLVKKS